MKLDLSQPQRVSAMSEDRQSEDRQLLELVLQAQRLRRKIDDLQSQGSELCGSEMVHHREMVRLQLSLRRTLNELNKVLLTSDRFQKLHNHLANKYYWLQQYPTIWERLWNKAIGDRLFWLNQCSNKREPGALPAYTLYDPDYQGSHGAASVWTWFVGTTRNNAGETKTVIEARILSQMETQKFKEELKQQSLDAPITNDGEKTGGTLGDKIPDLNRNEPSDGRILVQLLRDDPDDIFTYKTVRSKLFNYKTVALLKAEGFNASQIASRFAVQASAITRPLESWNNYYRPYLNEFLFGEFCLSYGLSTKIREDKNGEFGKIILNSQYPNVSLHQTVIWKLEGLSWLQIVRQLQPQPATKLVILFFLDEIQKVTSQAQNKT